MKVWVSAEPEAVDISFFVGLLKFLVNFGALRTDAGDQFKQVAPVLSVVETKIEGLFGFHFFGF
jgi:hypothetical protein